MSPEYRIIPARAGFTATRAPMLRNLGDHPRSRGVYVSAVLGPLQQRGSSPLARGLHGRGPPVGEPRRIIPARAGFTSSL